MRRKGLKREGKIRGRETSEDGYSMMPSVHSALHSINHFDHLRSLGRVFFLLDPPSTVLSYQKEGTISRFTIEERREIISESGMEYRGEVRRRRTRDGDTTEREEGDEWQMKRRKR